MRFKILIVDDEPDIVALLSKFLHNAGYDIDSASNGLEAFEKIKSWNPDLVVSDVQMPIWDGFKLLQNLQNLQQERKVPVLIISGYAGGDESELTQYPNYAGFIAKPFNIKKFIASVNSFFNGQNV